jgi:hypothetical protein
MKKTLAVISLIIALIVAINEMTWIGKSDLAWPLIGIAIAIGLVAIIPLLREER